MMLNVTIGTQLYPFHSITFVHIPIFRNQLTVVFGLGGEEWLTLRTRGRAPTNSGDLHDQRCV